MDKIKENYPVSIFGIAKTYNLDTLYILDDNFSGYVELYNNSIKNKIKLRFGVQLVVCQDINNKTEESFQTESKINLWILNLKGYSDLLKIYSLAATDGFYYIPRIDWTTLNKMLTKNIGVSIPFYDSFLFNNNLKRHKCIPDLPVDCKFHIENHNLPFDLMVEQFVHKYIREDKTKIIRSNQCYYFQKDDIDAYTTFRCATKSDFSDRQSLYVPNLEHFGSDCFCFEHYLELCQNQ
jgi:DNA polymerase-3 subunit alpha